MESTVYSMRWNFWLLRVKLKLDPNDPELRNQFLADPTEYAQQYNKRLQGLKNS